MKILILLGMLALVATVVDFSIFNGKNSQLVSQAVVGQAAKASYEVKRFTRQF